MSERSRTDEELLAETLSTIAVWDYPDDEVMHVSMRELRLLAKALASARDAAIEECAKEAENQRLSDRSDCDCYERAAEAIRALKGRARE